jgi:uncharacterized membrane-anchored protein YhcB (DUF1043 family)
VYGVGWLVMWAILALAAGVAIGAGVARGKSHRSADRVRELERQLETAHRALEDYRAEVIDQFSATARKFQSLNEAYGELHQQLARSSSILCGEHGGPLLPAPHGQQELIAAPITTEPAPDISVADLESEMEAAPAGSIPVAQEAANEETDARR